MSLVKIYLSTGSRAIMLNQLSDSWSKQVLLAFSVAKSFNLVPSTRQLILDLKLAVNLLHDGLYLSPWSTRGAYKRAIQRR